MKPCLCLPILTIVQPRAIIQAKRRREEIGMRKRTVWLLASCLMVVTLVLASCTTTPSNQDASQPTELSIQIVSVTQAVSPGENATLIAETTPGANCDIEVYYKSGPSEASGLYPKTADSDGYVSWTWMVGTNTTPGSWEIVVSASYDSQTDSDSTYFTVLD
jgi:hypothetical protein